ncbi:phage integrase SAM-like domain-containing protein [uncultured Fibrobacter sp.]|mgnify:FL=1|uniref:phage integrase SAM-like domain-containing protein n=1 Tax=uncultured Fibrobacter sp. TaxID=261512 RepID=UPI0026328C62|nr:phage integrase SAM-like domain-containing protein [uncultured Fibrobacter sp.]
MSDFYAETRAIVESKASTLSKYTYDTYLSHLQKLQMYRPTAECRDITEAFVFGYIDFMHARKNSAGCIY